MILTAMDKILQGAQTGTLPVEQPRKVELNQSPRATVVFVK
jgi:hypothetical protein